jgi:DNA-binding transcriptional MerR regulator
MRQAKLCGGIVLLCVIGCTNPQAYVDVAREQRDARKEIAEILETVHDEKSMANAKKKLDDRQAHYEAIARKASALPQNPSEEVKKRLEQERYLMDRAMERLQEQITRVSKMPGGKDFFKHFESSSQNLFLAVQP